MRVLGLLDAISEQPDVEIYASDHGVTRVILGDRVTRIPDASTILLDAPDGCGAPGDAALTPDYLEGNRYLKGNRQVKGSADRSDDVALALHYAHQAAQEIADYLRGTRERFSVPLDPAPTSPFTTSVHATIATISYGQRWTYAQLAEALGIPGAARAVGTACGKNPLPILVPCHRVVRADGTLGRYTGGDAIKVALLAIEARR